MPTSIAHQSLRELGGRSSILARQRSDHARLEQLLQQLRSTSGQEQQEVLDRVCRLVFTHAFAEETVLWPAARRLLPGGDDLTREIEEEHQQINELTTRLERSRPGDADREVLLQQAYDLLDTDVREEEDELLPRLQEAADVGTLRRLGWAWELVRQVSPTRAHPTVSRRPPGNVLSALPLSVLDRGRDRLDVLARRAPGRTGRSATRLSSGLARVAGLVERLPASREGDGAPTSR